MVIDIAKALHMPGVPMPFHFVLDAMEDLPSAMEMLPTANIEGTVLFLGKDTFRVEGTLEIPYKTHCARCVADVIGCLKVDFTEEFAKEENDENLDRYLFTGSRMELAQMIGDLVFVHFPAKSVCKEDCAGLCPICGQDRNVVPCSCSVPLEGNNNNTKPLAGLAEWLSKNQ